MLIDHITREEYLIELDETSQLLFGKDFKYTSPKEAEEVIEMVYDTFTRPKAEYESTEQL